MGLFSRAPARKFKSKKSQKLPLLPAALEGFIAQRVTDFSGAALMGSGAALALMLMSFDPKDPSFNTVSSGGAVHNMFGSFGAHVSDMLLQTLGMSSYFFAIAFMVWGLRIFRRKPLVAFSTRMPLLIAAVLCGSIALARVPAFASWGIGSYLGGSAGALVFALFGNHLQGALGATAFVFVAITAFAGFVVSYMIALGLTVGEWIELYWTVRDKAVRLFDVIMAFVDRIKDLRAAQEEDVVAAPRKKRIRVRDDADDAEDEEEMEEVVEAPKRKPVVTLRSEKPKSAAPKEDRQKKLNLRSSDDEWQLPPLDILQDRVQTVNAKMDEAALQKNAEMLQATLRDFGVEGDILKVSPGPIVALYEMEPAPGTKTSRVIGLSDDIARSMSAVSVRIAVVPGKNVIGIELPNAKRETVFLKEMLASKEYQKTACKLPLVLGKNIAGDPIVADLTRMPHLLVAGTTGSGKSVAVNAMLLSLLYKLSPEQCRLIMIDPKMLELSVYADIPHLLTPVVTEAPRAITALKWAVREMEDRYRAMSKLGVRNIDGFNERIRDARAKGIVLMHKIQTGFDADTGKPVFEEQPISQVELPYIVIIVDEFADLMLVAGKDVEGSIQRLAQMARAAGIHLIMATQRPSVDVITGVIKANFPTRISFQVTSKIDSRTILGEGGAEQLLGHGDMLYMAAGGRVTRVHGPFVTDDEVESTVKYLRSQGTPVYIEGVTVDPDEGEGDTVVTTGGGVPDALYDQAVALILRERKVSTSFIQRHLQIGYNRAASIVDRMEREGLITGANHAGKRDILTGNYGT